MRWLLFMTLFLLVLFPQRGMTQGSAKMKELQVFKDSGTVKISVADLISEPALRKKYFTYIEYAKKGDDNRSLLLKSKYSIKPIVRIEVDNGTPNLSMKLDSLYEKTQMVIDFKVENIYKRDLQLRVKIIDNYNNALLADGVFVLNPVVVHEYYPELHYTDVDGNSQVYTKDSSWIPISPTSSAKVVVKDEYGKNVKVFSCSLVPTSWMWESVSINESDTLSSWQVRVLSECRDVFYVTSVVEDENNNKKRVTPMKIKVKN